MECGGRQSLKIQKRIKNPKDPMSIRKVASKISVDNLFNNLSRFKNADHVNFKIYNLDNVRFVKVTSFPAVGEHVTAKCYANEAISKSVEESLLLCLDFEKKVELNEQDSIILNSILTTLKTRIETLLKTMSIAYMKTIEISEMYLKY